MYFPTPFIMQNFLSKNPWHQIGVMIAMIEFSSQNSPFAPNQNFFRKTINISSTYLLASFIMQNLKKILRANPKLCALLGLKWSICPKSEFFSEKPLI